MSNAQAVETIDADNIVPMEERNPARPITPMDMLQIAVQSGADLEKLEKLMGLQERWEANEARKAFVVAFAKFKRVAPKVGKDKHVNFQTSVGDVDYHHTTLGNAVDTLAPVLGKCGFTHHWVPEQLDGGAIRITCVLTHIKGHTERASLQAGADTSGKKNPIQAVGSTTTYLERYTLLAVCGIATEDQDNDAAHTDPTVTDEQKQAIIAKMKEVGADTVAFLKYMNVGTVDELPAAEFDRAMSALASKQKKEA